MELMLKKCDQDSKSQWQAEHKHPWILMEGITKNWSLRKYSSNNCGHQDLDKQKPIHLPQKSCKEEMAN
ncbi:hypothetical protein E2C01_016642 [Portunus trituberculatus]|uniref:Uncharacterized protein n=1 Tax=Portunus trituberculatus TaxID=210409 RepID=A0A5B7DQS3_PORTR|nr:hypothetical protein [Portunus trituberculatus]